MVKSQDKRMDKISKELPARERILVILTAIKNDDFSTVESLLSSTPKKNYTKIDASVTSSVQAVENLSLRFDRTYYKLSATMLAIGLSGYDEDETKQGEDELSREICALFIGTKLFADKVGLSVDQLLAFSTAIEQGTVLNTINKGCSAKNMDIADAEAMCRAWEALWEPYSKFSPFTVAA
jgi:hypothetical protein